MQSQLISADVDIDSSAYVNRDKTCSGVPAFVGLPSLHCDADLRADQLKKCDACSVEIDRRVNLEQEGRVSEGQKQLLKSAGLSEPFITGKKSLDTVRLLTPQHAEAVTHVRRLLDWRGVEEDGNSRGVLVRGDAGIGKTDIGEGFVREARMRGLNARYINARDLAARLQESFRDDAPQSARAIIAAIGGVRFLCIDDLGATKTTRFVADSFYSLFEMRARNQAPTLAITNYLSIADLAHRLRPTDGDDLDAIRPVDRIEENCPNVVTLRGMSLRSTISRSAAE